MASMEIDAKSNCPCGSGKQYSQCCRPYHQHQIPAPTPEALMRSRYAAFVLHLFGYLEKTHHPDFRHGLTATSLAQGKQPDWLTLNVISSEQQDCRGTVLFKAWYKIDGKLDAIYEQSNFLLVDKHCFYTDGEQYQTALPKRNDSCICGSGRKFKLCCMNKLLR
ncbi:YchJ family metal-binding protein [Shewanella sp. A32]|uniref:YchJ family protein n=1 Tax=Shewanella sp. A32 TaxID=3031327 RepID=UPI0023B942E8|nr:YchJ family metal-binding protein [Shewanella sp. A32]MDF0535910.1 YchJ family metal-binding protein [Shewanella sp. A32]